MAAILHTTFQIYFLELKFLYFDSNFIAICVAWSNQQSTSIDLNNGLDPNRQRAIIWTSDN